MSSFFMTLSHIARAVQQSNRRRRRGCRLRLIGCLAFFGLLIALAVLLLFSLIGRAGALEAEPQREDLTVQLVIDNSNSMFDKGGVGSDPGLLRMAAARLFIEYLGVDDTRFRPLCGLVFFGSEARQMASPAPLVDATQRAGLIELLAEPERMGWTDQLAALETARAGMAAASGRKVIVILTDGKPEWSDLPTPEENAAYRDRMAELGQQLGEEGITLFIVLLGGPLTDGDITITEFWRPMWETMAGTTPEGQFLIARDAHDLPAIYHNILVALTGRESDGVVVDGTVTSQGLRETVVVEQGLSRMVLAVRKSHENTKVTILRPDGTVLQAYSTGSAMRQSGGLLEEIWTIEEPEPGTWQVTATGEGRLTVWKDFEVAPPTPTATKPFDTPAPSAKATPAPTRTAVPTATVTATATVTPVVASPVDQVELATPTKSWGFILWPLSGATVLMAVAGGYFLARQRSSRPVLSGTLHVLGGAEQPRSQSAFDLYELGKTVVTIGAGETDIRLPSVATPITLQLQKGTNGQTEIVVRANPEVIHNGRRLLIDQPVYDGDLFVTGKTRLRYENLQRRRPRRRQAGDRKSERPHPTISA